MRRCVFLLLCALGFVASASAAFPLPIVVWHGVGDSCCDPKGIGRIVEKLREELGVYVYSIATREGRENDIRSGFIGNINDQVKKVCDDLRAIPELQDGFNGIGFSQGGQFMRAVVERCQHTGPRMHKLITLGSQHQGVQNMPGCIIETDWCKEIQNRLTDGAYVPWVQENWIQAQYTKDPYKMETYLKTSIFLADINNEREEKNEQYKANLASLEKFVLFRFLFDIVVVPRDSSWFSFFDGEELIPLHELTMFKEDWIGLRELHERGDLIFGDIPSGHMHFTWEWFKIFVVDKYLLADETS